MLLIERWTLPKRLPCVKGAGAQRLRDCHTIQDACRGTEICHHPIRSKLGLGTAQRSAGAVALCATAPSSSIKGRERVYSLGSFFEEGLRFSPLSGEKLRIVLTWRVLAATLGSCWKKYMLMTNTAGQGCSAPLQGRGGSTPTPPRKLHGKNPRQRFKGA